ncbi:MAG: PKD domain-containing protein [Bacteroidales bacterium]
MKRMNNMTGKTKFEKELKQKLEAYEPVEYNSDWQGIEKKLPSSGGTPWLNALLITGGIIIVAAIAILSLPEREQENNKPLITKETSKEKDNIPEENKKENTFARSDNQKDPAQNIPTDTSEQNITDESENLQTAKTVKQEANKPSDENTSKSDRNDDTKNDTDLNNTENLQKESETESQETQNTEKESEVEHVIEVSKTEGCLPLEVSFESNANPEEYKFTWHFGDGTTSSEINPVHTYTEPGEYQPVLHLNHKENDLTPKRVTCQPITCQGFNDAKINFDKDGNLFIFNTVENGDIFYHWEIDGETFNTASVEYEFRKDGQYRIDLQLKDNFGCELETSRTVDVEIEHNYFVPNAINLSSNGVNASFGPVGENLHMMEYRMLIFDKNGQLVFETDDINRPWTGRNIRTNEPAEAGVYLWKITTKDKYGNVKHKKGQVTLFRK